MDHDLCQEVEAEEKNVDVVCSFRACTLVSKVDNYK